MNTANNINTANTNTTNTTIESKQPVTTNRSNRMIESAELLFWVTVALQIFMFLNDIRNQAFADFVIYNVWPLIGALAYAGLRREQKAISSRNNECCQTQDSNC